MRLCFSTVPWLPSPPAGFFKKKKTKGDDHVPPFRVCFGGRATTLNQQDDDYGRKTKFIQYSDFVSSKF